MDGGWVVPAAEDNEAEGFVLHPGEEGKGVFEEVGGGGMACDNSEAGERDREGSVAGRGK